MWVNIVCCGRIGKTEEKQIQGQIYLQRSWGFFLSVSFWTWRFKYKVLQRLLYPQLLQAEIIWFTNLFLVCYLSAPGSLFTFQAKFGSQSTLKKFIMPPANAYMYVHILCNQNYKIKYIQYLKETKWVPEAWKSEEWQNKTPRSIVNRHCMQLSYPDWSCHTGFIAEGKAVKKTRASLYILAFSLLFCSTPRAGSCSGIFFLTG